MGLRYVVHVTDSMLQDSVTYSHATLLMPMAGYTRLKDDRVRMDMFHANASARGRARVDAGCVVLLGILCWFGWPYVRAAWKIHAGGMFFGGLPFTYLPNSVVAAFVVLVATQSVALLLRAIAVIGRGRVPVFDPPAESAWNGGPAARPAHVRRVVPRGALSGAPIAFVLAGTAAIFAAIGWYAGVLNFHLIGAMPTRVFKTMVSRTLIAIPLFIFMGRVLERSPIAEDLLRTMGGLFDQMRGGHDGPDGAAGDDAHGLRPACSSAIIGASRTPGQTIPP